MNIVDFALLWSNTLTEYLADQGVVLTASASEETRPKTSCSINLKKPDSEANLVIWDTGEAELCVAGSLGETECEHLEIEDSAALRDCLTSLLEAMRE